MATSFQRTTVLFQGQSRFFLKIILEKTTIPTNRVGLFCAHQVHKKKGPLHKEPFDILCYAKIKT